MSRVAMLICVLSAVCTVYRARAQAIHTPVSAAYLGAGAYSTHHIDVFSFGANQAALARLTSACAGVYGEKRFLLKELSLYNAVIALPAHSGNFGLDGRYFGFPDYNETQLGLAYARTLGGKIDVGIQFNYYRVQIAGYGNASSINFEVGTILHLTDQLNAGLHVCNPMGRKLGENGEEKLASLYTVGIGFEASDNFLFSTEVRKEENQPADVTAGLQYKFLSQLIARLGVSVITSSMYMGFGLTWRSMRLDATASYHSQLGITPGILMIVSLSPKAKSNQEAK